MISATAALAVIVQSVNLMKAEASFLLASVGEEQVQIQSADSWSKGWIVVPCHLLSCFDSLLLHCAIQSVSSAMWFGFGSWCFLCPFGGKQNCINYRFCSKCLVQVFILFLNVSNRMVVLEAVYILGIHWGCVFWYFKAVLVNCKVMTMYFGLVWGISLRKNAGFCCSARCLEHRKFSAWFLAVLEEVEDKLKNYYAHVGKQITQLLWLSLMVGGLACELAIKAHAG